MQYVGSKSKIAVPIVSLLNELRSPGQAYYEPFIGGGSIGSRVSDPRFLSDVNPDLIALYQGILDGVRDFPLVMTEGEYRSWKKKPISAHRAWVGFHWGYRGKFFGMFDYLRKERPQSAIDELVAQVMKFEGATLRCCPYWELEPVDALVYCDPPYVGTAKYEGVDAFCHAKFWRHLTEEWHERGNMVIVSEYVAPKNWPAVKIFPTTTSIHRKVRLEKLFVHESHAATVRAVVKDLGI